MRESPRSILDPVQDVVRDSAHRLTGSAGDFDPLMKRIATAQFVLVGDASHGIISTPAFPDSLTP